MSAEESEEPPFEPAQEEVRDHWVLMLPEPGHSINEDPYMWGDTVAELAPFEDDIPEGNAFLMPLEYDENKSLMSTMRGDKIIDFPELLSETSHGTAPGMLASQMHPSTTTLWT